jgi:excisionase family DNA binding protein
MHIFQVGRLAKAIGVHRNTVSNWIKRGRLLAQPTAGKRYLVDEAHFQQFCRENGIEVNVIASLNDLESQESQAVKTTQPSIHQPVSEVPMSDKPLGSVMVVGGGIAGMQAALDLADSGYYVYMVEKSAGIGGVMAQLDKTFPTNDCAM